MKKANIIYLVIVAILIVNIAVAISYYIINFDVLTSVEFKPAELETEYDFKFEGTNLEPLTLQTVLDGTRRYQQCSVEYLEEYMFNNRHTNWGWGD